MVAKNTFEDSGELDLAGEIQQLLFPKSSPVCDWCCIGLKNRMARGLGGDYFDFITMPDQCQTFLIGDVTGHGLYASVVMSLIYGFIHRAVQGACDPLDLVLQVNDFLVAFSRRSQRYDHYFSSTLFFSIINPETLMMQYVNAGHVPPLVARDGRIIPLEATAPPVGFFEAPEMAIASFDFKRGDRLFLYTDGITEAANSRGELFGTERLRGLLLAGAEDYATFLDELFRALRAFGAADPPLDDCTAMVVDFHGM
jgi:serine phosphatase RsbU (regulator of sigma subunit)